MKKKIIAIIPARKNSKRVKNKNIKNIGNKKLIWYSINAALKSKYISEVIVSTDCKKIKSYAENCGAKVPFLRPKHLSTDNAQMIDVVKYIYKELIKVRDRIDLVILLQPTSPLRDNKDIDSAIKFFEKKKADYVTSFSEAKPKAWNFELDDEKRFNYNDIFKSKNNKNKNYLLNGAIYIYNKKLLVNKKKTNVKSFGFVMPTKKSIDIDYESDFEIAKHFINIKDRN